MKTLLYTVILSLGFALAAKAAHRFGQNVQKLQDQRFAAMEKLTNE